MWRSRAWQREVGCAARGANPERTSCNRPHPYQADARRRDVVPADSSALQSVHASSIDQHQLLDVGVASTHMRGAVRSEGGVAHPRAYAPAIRGRARSRDPGFEHDTDQVPRDTDVSMPPLSESVAGSTHVRDARHLVKRNTTVSCPACAQDPALRHVDDQRLIRLRPSPQ
jgi:hypothetical protein